MRHGVRLIIFRCYVEVYGPFIGAVKTMLLIVSFHYVLPHAGSWVVRIDPLRFLAGCRTRRLNQALSVLSLIVAYYAKVK